MKQIGIKDKEDKLEKNVWVLIENSSERTNKEENKCV
jgi:hypothetical protein